MSALIIAIDGPAGAGKSTVSKMLADKLQAKLLDTGAFYRAITLAMMRANIQPDGVTPELLQDLDIRQEFLEGVTKMYLNNVDVSEDIRLDEVSRNVSLFAAIEVVRKYAVQLQQVYLQESVEEGKSVIIEGRDIATVVAPNANLKIFLTASAEVRARRRSLELSSSETETLESINERDRMDSSRDISPLRKSHDAIEIDATNRSQDQVVEEICSLINRVRS